MEDPGAFCGHCGGVLDADTLCDSDQAREASDHTDCERRLAMEPPRYCTICRRRMKVQVTPRGWSATCVEHGTRTG
jgi:hypothetical protein